MPNNTAHNVMAEIARILDKNAPQSLNGYPVIRTRLLNEAGSGLRQMRVILVDRDPRNETPKMHGRYVTAMHCEHDSEWFWGHYICTLDAAITDYKTRGG